MKKDSQILLEVSHLSVSYGSYQVLKDISFSLSEGQWLMLIGPNGAGKSTIVNAVSRAVPYTGTILYRGKNIGEYPARELARNIGVLAQNHYVGYSFTVSEVVRLGRYAYNRGLFSQGDETGEEQIEQALKLTGLTELAGKSVLELSGGELQRVFLAQLFAQDPKILILDEPTNHLDLVYQQQVFTLIRTWLTEPDRAVISVVHDLSLAKAFGTEAILMKDGKALVQGKMDDVFAPEHLQDAYSLDVYKWMQTMLGQWVHSV